MFSGKADLSADLLRQALKALDAHLEVRRNRDAGQAFGRDEAIDSLAAAVK